MRKNLFGELEMGEENDADKPNHSLSIGCMQIMWPNYKGEESLWELARLLWLAVVCSLLKTGHQFKSQPEIAAANKTGNWFGQDTTSWTFMPT